MSNFTTVNLTGDRVLVKGTDRFGTEGQTVLDATQWTAIKAEQGFTEAKENFDAEVEEFFRPLTEAAAKLDSAAAPQVEDPATYVVIHEGVEATAGEQRVVRKLDADSVVLRLIERGDTDRLVWVLDRLEVMTVEELPVDGGSDEG